MKTVQRTIYLSFDGVEFETATDCREWERDNAGKRLVALTAEQVEAALTRADPELADAIETVGERIKRKRLDDGDYKRRPSGVVQESVGSEEEDAALLAQPAGSGSDGIPAIGEGDAGAQPGPSPASPEPENVDPPPEFDRRSAA